ncbi:hypothetical protein niasHT_024914 [Heterodera trifolii]|uniref:Uncharacterized protein n=1 Tax=Heterodera trifolii TaxID=157864 RepID=A0ABD2JZB1_9BILA
MVHIVFDPSIAEYDDYMMMQYGGGLEKDDFDYFRGSTPFQRGYGAQRGAGVGDVFRGLWRFFLPILRRVGTTVGSEALSTGQRVLERVGNEGMPIKEALVTEGKRGIDTVLDKGGLPKQFGTGKNGYKKKTNTCTKSSNNYWRATNPTSMTFHKIDNDSVNSITNALDFFRIPPTNVSVSSSKVFELLPSNPLTDTPYHFKLHSSQNYIDLSKCYLLTEFRIRKENANGQLMDLTIDDENIAPIQMIGQTFIRNIKMSINGREVFNANALMAYKTYFSHELSYSTTAKDSHLNAAGYYRDTGATLETGSGFIQRRDLFAESKTAQFIAKIDTDLFNQPLYLINFCELDVEILPNDNDFVLIAPTGGRYRFEIMGLKMYVKKVSLMDGLALDIARKLEIKPARYAVRKTMMKSMFISQGRFEFTANLFMDQIPRRITMGLVSNADYSGTITRSPFNFQPFNVREIAIIANGRAYPQAPYDLDYPHGKYVRAFNDMNEAVGFANSSESNGITFPQFGKTRCIYVFNLTSSGDDQAALFDLIKNGTTAVSIKFNRAVPVGGLMLVVMGECDSLGAVSTTTAITTTTTTTTVVPRVVSTRTGKGAVTGKPSKIVTTGMNTTTVKNKNSSSKTTTTTPTRKTAKLVADEQLPVATLLPTLIHQMCKDRPGEENFYQQAVCWALFALYLMVIVSLILHQLCSICWLKKKKEVTAQYGQRADFDYFEAKSGNRTSFPGLFPK